MRRVVAATVALAALMIPTQVDAQQWEQPKECAKWNTLFNEYFPKKDVPVRDRRHLKYVMWRESRCIAGATGFNYVKPFGPNDCVRAHWREYMRTCKHLRPYGRGVDWGLMQVNGSWRSVTIKVCGKAPETGILLDPRCNLSVARYLYDNGGIGHWRGSSGQ